MVCALSHNASAPHPERVASTLEMAAGSSERLYTADQGGKASKEGRLHRLLIMRKLDTRERETHIGSVQA